MLTLTAQNSDSKTVRDLIDRAAAFQPTVAFLVSPETNDVLTFGDLRQGARHLCAELFVVGSRPAIRSPF